MSTGNNFSRSLFSVSVSVLFSLLSLSEEVVDDEVLPAIVINIFSSEYCS